MKRLIAKDQHKGIALILRTMRHRSLGCGGPGEHCALFDWLGRRFAAGCHRRCLNGGPAPVDRGIPLYGGRAGVSAGNVGAGTELLSWRGRIRRDYFVAVCSWKSAPISK